MKSKTSTLASDPGAEVLTSKKDDETVNILVANLTDDILPEKFEITKKDTAQVLFDRYCDDLVRIYNLGQDSDEIKNSQLIMKSERNYFGLRFSDSEGRLHWLENDKLLLKQLHDARARFTVDSSPIQYKITFRVKHYPSRFEDLASSLSHYLFFLQIRRDLIQGRLLCPRPEDFIKVGALIYQAEEGDANYSNIAQMISEIEKSEDSVYNKKLFLRPQEGPDKRILMAYLELKGRLSKTQAVHALLDMVTSFPTYGIDPFQVEPQFPVQLPLSESNGENSQLVVDTSAVDSDSVQKKVKRSKTFQLANKAKTQPELTRSASSNIKAITDGKTKPNYYLGISHFGLQLYVGTTPSMSWSWEQIVAMKYSKNVFKMTAKAPESDKKSKDSKLAFRMQSASAALGLWKWAHDRKFFFTLTQGKKVKPVKSSTSLLKRGVSFKFSGISQADVQRNVQSFRSTTQKEIAYTSMRIVNMNGVGMQKLEALGISKTAKASTSSRPALEMQEFILQESDRKPETTVEAVKQEKDSIDSPREKLSNGFHENPFDRQASIISEKSSEKSIVEGDLVTPQLSKPVNAAPVEANGHVTGNYQKSNGHVSSRAASPMAQTTNLKPIIKFGLIAVLGVAMAFMIFVLEARKRPAGNSNELQKLAYQMRRLSLVDGFGKTFYDPIRDALLSQTGEPVVKK